LPPAKVAEVAEVAEVAQMACPAGINELSAGASISQAVGCLQPHEQAPDHPTAISQSRLSRLTSDFKLNSNQHN